MGQFLVKHVDLNENIEFDQIILPNLLAYEGIEHVYRQLFPPYHAAMSFVLGVASPNTEWPYTRPNNGAGGYEFGPLLAWHHCVDVGINHGNEGGCYTDTMRDSFGYVRRTVAFTASMEADGGAFVCEEVTFPNNHQWSPQPASDWNLPWTSEIEQAPPEWSFWEHWEPVLGYPWHCPRKRCSGVCNPEDPYECVPAYMEQWDSSGRLNWLCDFRKIGGFPITLTFLGDSSRNKLIAVAAFRAPVLLRPGTALHIRYQARVFGMISRDFAYRFVRYAFGKVGSRYDTIYCRPVLATAPKPTRRTTYAELLDHFHAHFDAVALSSWTYVAGPPPYIESTNVPQWTNSSGNRIGPFAWLAVYGSIGSSNELMWLTPIDPPVSVSDGDTLRVPSKVRFQLEGV